MTLVLFIAPDDRLAGWWLVEAGRIAERGAVGDVLPEALPERVVAIAPAEAATIHVAELGTLGFAQARTAARLLVAETSVAPIETQHVAVGAADGADRAVAVIGNGRMAAWLEALQAHGVDADAVFSAGLMLPRPEQGYVRGAVGAETVLRGRSTAFADADALTPLLVGDAEIEDVDGEAAVLAAIAAGELDLRQGPFARRRRFQVDWANVRRVARLGAAIAVVTLLIAMVQIVRYGSGADAMDAEAERVAQAVAPEGGVAGLQARLAGRRGGGLGFTTSAGAVIQAVQATPNVELASLIFEPDGMLRATVVAPGAADAEALRSRLRAGGLTVEATPFAAEGGRIRGEFRIGR